MQESPETTSYLTPEYLRKHHWRLPEDEERREQLLTETEAFFDALIATAAESLGEEGRAKTITFSVTVKAAVEAGCLCFCPARYVGTDDLSTGGCTRPCLHVPW